MTDATKFNLTSIEIARIYHEIISSLERFEETIKKERPDWVELLRTGEWELYIEKEGEWVEDTGCYRKTNVYGIRLKDGVIL
jgi:hypothetical protein